MSGSNWNFGDDEFDGSYFSPRPVPIEVGRSRGSVSPTSQSASPTSQSASPDVDATSESAWRNFRGDMSRALSASRRELTTTALSAVAVAASAWVFSAWGGGAGGVPGIALFAAWVVYGGVQRWWFSDLLEGRRIGIRGVAAAFRSMVVRFLLLGVWILIPAFIAILTYVVVYLVQHPHLADRSYPRVPNPPSAFTITLFVATAAVADVLLTFVMPALALSTRSVRQAGRLGVGMIARTWPTSAFYVLTPTLTALATVYCAPIPDVPWLILLVAVGLSSFWVKGATVAFYLRNMQNPELAASPESPPTSG